MKGEAATLVTAPNRIGDFVALAKPRLNSLVVVSAGVGYYLGAASVDFGVMLHTIAGSGLVAGGAAALNQVLERDTDAAMQRTRLRPVAAGRVTRLEGTLFAAALGAAGLAELALRVNLLAAAVALATLITYVAIYTPLKRRTPWATTIGAVPGALPPVIGWAAARGALTVEAWVLFGIVFLWQLPHFRALSWLYRDDYNRAGLPVLAARDPRGRRTARDALLHALALVPVSLTPSLVGLAGTGHLLAAMLLGVAFVLLALRFLQRPDDSRARALFTASLVYLPLLWGSLIAARVL